MPLFWKILCVFHSNIVLFLKKTSQEGFNGNKAWVCNCIAESYAASALFWVLLKSQVIKLGQVLKYRCCLLRLYEHSNFTQYLLYKYPQSPLVLNETDVIVFCDHSYDLVSSIIFSLLRHAFRVKYFLIYLTYQKRIHNFAKHLGWCFSWK